MFPQIDISFVSQALKGMASSLLCMLKQLMLYHELLAGGIYRLLTLLKDEFCSTPTN
jgi:hypothetical protein